VTIRASLDHAMGLLEYITFLWYSLLKIFNFSPLPYPPTPSTGAIIVTGASTGIGQHAAHHLATLGYIVFAGVRNKQDGDRLISESSNDRLLPLIIDVTSESSIDLAYEKVVKKLKKDDLPLIALVNNAGITYGTTVEGLDFDKAHALFEVNVWGAIRVSQKFLPLIRESKGRVVNISSIAAEITQPLAGLYSASKRSLLAFNDAMRTEVQPQGISVSLVLPGAIKSNIWKTDAYPALPSDLQTIYNNLYTKRMKTRSKMTNSAVGPEVTSKVIAHAITSRVPRAYYYAGKDASIFHILQLFVSSRTIDYIQLKLM